MSNLCGIALTSADNILISAFISVGTVGVYGNYLTLKKYISRLMDTLFGSIAAGIGDVCAGEDTEKKEHLFLRAAIYVFLAVRIHGDLLLAPLQCVHCPAYGCMIPNGFCRTRQSL